MTVNPVWFLFLNTNLCEGKLQEESRKLQESRRHECGTKKRIKIHVTPRNCSQKVSLLNQQELFFSIVTVSTQSFILNGILAKIDSPNHELGTYLRTIEQSRGKYSGDYSELLETELALADVHKEELIDNFFQNAFQSFQGNGNIKLMIKAALGSVLEHSRCLSNRDAPAEACLHQTVVPRIFLSKGDGLSRHSLSFSTSDLVIILDHIVHGAVHSIFHKREFNHKIDGFKGVQFSGTNQQTARLENPHEYLALSDEFTFTNINLPSDADWAG